MKMTEKEWTAAIMPGRMLDVRGKRISERKLRLLAVGCCRRVVDRMTNGSFCTAVEVAERYADGVVTKRDWQRTTSTIRRTPTLNNLANYAVHVLVHPDPIFGAKYCSNAVALAVAGTNDPENQTAAEFKTQLTELQQHAVLLRCIAGERYRIPKMKPAWLTSDVLALARGIYDERAFDRMPILADALQDAGCTNKDVLNHCRGDGPHVRGCWVVDLVLGKQ